ncbi:hypothetical protein Hanom_Chr12g01142371 [Helianthus anomalus]
MLIYNINKICDFHSCGLWVLLHSISVWKTDEVKWRFVDLCSCNMFDEHVYEIEHLILIVLWIYNMKHWRFEEVWGLRS